MNTHIGHLQLKTYADLPNLSVCQGSESFSTALHPNS